jgi:CheY-like chemotaxis protein
MEKVKTTSKIRNILLIDSDKGLTRDIKDYVERHEIQGKMGLNFTFVENAQEAMKKIAEKKTDLVILEIVLPIINGYYLLNTIKKENIPVIIYTKLKNSQDLAKMATYEVDNIFLKELVKIEDLINTIGSKESCKEELDHVIVELKNQLKTLSGSEESQAHLKTTQCPHCTMIVAPNSHFCNNCGHKIIRKNKKILVSKEVVKVTPEDVQAKEAVKVTTETEAQPEPVTPTDDAVETPASGGPSNQEEGVKEEILDPEKVKTV